MNAAEKFAEDALQFEQRTSFLAKAPDTAESFARFHGVMKHALVKAGRGVVGPWPAPRPCNEMPRVGFFMPTATMLAHSRNLLTYLDALAEHGVGSLDKSDPLGQRAIKPIVYTFGPPPVSEETEFSAAYWRHDVRYIEGTSVFEHWRNLRMQACTDDLDAMVFVSVVQGMAFATSMGVAPKHIWWAHKWHGLDLPHLDGYIDACHPFHDGEITIAGRTWRSTYTALPEMFDAAKTEEAKKLRAAMDVAVVFGWMGRAEKITSEYLTAVVDILSQVPDSIFVYTGREESPAITQALAQVGMADRTAFLGWIDTALWAQVIDVYLDTFPFQSGHCAYQAMAAGKPVVWLHDEATAEEQSASGLIKATWEQGAREIFEDEVWTGTEADYVAAAVRLAGANRAEIGARYRRWLECFMMDRQKMAASVSAAILDVING